MGFMTMVEFVRLVMPAVKYVLLPTNILAKIVNINFISMEINVCHALILIAIYALKIYVTSVYKVTIKIIKIIVWNLEEF